MSGCWIFAIVGAALVWAGKSATDASPRDVNLGAWLAALEHRRASPPGYRFPTAHDLSGDWAEHRKEQPEPYHVRGDFDRNGLIDDAWVLMREHGPGWGVFAFLEQRKGPPRVIKLMSDEKSIATRMFVETVDEPGTWETACGKGYWDCAPGEPSEVRLVGGELLIEYSESSEFVCLWRRDHKSFQRIQLSD
jgi:hypothetical protein